MLAHKRCLRHQPGDRKPAVDNATANGSTYDLWDSLDYDHAGTEMGMIPLEALDELAHAHNTPRGIRQRARVILALFPIYSAGKRGPGLPLEPSPRCRSSYWPDTRANAVARGTAGPATTVMKGRGPR
jgi:hypothetical protein